MFRGLKLSQRFAIMIGLFAAGFILYGAWSFKVLSDVKVNGPAYQRIVQGKDLIADILPPPEYIIESYLVSLQLAAAKDKPEQDALIARLKVLKKDYDTRHEFWLKENLESNITDKFLKDAHTPATVFYQTAFNDFIPALQKEDKEAGAAAAAAAMAKMKQSYETHRAAIDQVVALANKRNETDEAQARQDIDAAKWTSLTILAVSLGLGLVVAIGIMRRLLKSLGGEPEYAAWVSNKIAAGDLTVNIRLKQDDEHSLLFAMKCMRDKLVVTLAQLKQAVESVSTGSQQIAAGNRDLAQRTEREASALEKTASSMEELTSTVRQNADNARQANSLALSASEIAVKGGTMVSQVVETMGSINHSSKKIVDIIAVIDGIAFQTNILALNAAVEAARAGEQGRGFAVVAAEVRSLAQRSAAAAKEIKELIGSSVEKVDAGAKLVDEAGSTMNDIVDSVKRVTDIISEISAASQEQILGIEQVSNAISEMDEATQQNSALVEEAAAAANSLHSQADHLSRIIDMFRIEMHQKTGAPALGNKPKPPALPAKAAPKLASSKREVAAPAPASRREPVLKGRQDEDWEEF
ncbi:MAG: methyl-accepting chemotaxis protein [Burkholderiales bacterium]|nr:methyl-accepting chemotaxis protein [Burkholderiales bacterium]